MTPYAVNELISRSGLLGPSGRSTRSRAAACRAGSVLGESGLSSTGAATAHARDGHAARGILEIVHALSVVIAARRSTCSACL